MITTVASILAAGTTSPFVEDLAITLGVAAVTSVVFRRLGLPAVLGYLLAGLIVGPYLPLPLFADPARVSALSEFGVVLVMFGIGLHFSPRDLAAAIPKAGLVGLVQVSAMLWLGFVLGRAFGWGVLPSVFLGATVAISSTMVVARAIDEYGLPAATRDLVFGVLVIQDLVAVVMIAALTTVASGTGLQPLELAITTGGLLGFLALLVIVGQIIVPRALRMVGAMHHAETLIIAVAGLCFGMALLAAKAGYSVALGAFVAGSLAASSGLASRIEPLVSPIRDLFAAVFFVSVGMMVDPSVVLEVWHLAALVAVLVVGGQLVVVGLAAFVGGHGLRRGLHTGLALGQIGEFSFILAQLGVYTGAADPRMVPLVVVVAIVTATTTPLAVRHADRIAAWIDRALPHRVHTVAAHYESWIASLIEARRTRRIVGVRRFVRLAVIDATAVVAIVAATALARGPVVAAAARLGVAERVAAIGLGALTAALVVPFIIGMIRCGRAIGGTLARAALPHAVSGTDLAFAPRRALVVVLQIAALLVFGLPVLALTQPMLPAWLGPPALLVALGIVAVSFWRRADELDGHVRAGAQAVAELLRQTAGKPAEFEAQHIERVLPGLGEIASVRLPQDAAACGRTLAQLDLRGRTGATVLAIDREGEARAVPSSSEPLRPGDVLALVGTAPAIAGARTMLCDPPLATDVTSAKAGGGPRESQT